MTKIFTCSMSTLDGLDAMLDKYIKDKDVIDIKYQHSIDAMNKHFYSALVIYEDLIKSEVNIPKTIVSKEIDKK